MTVYERIKRRRKELGMTQEELAAKTGYTDRSGIAWIEAGRVDIPQSKLLKIADALEVTPSQLMGWDDEEEGVMIPVYGRVAAGEPIEASQDNIIGYEKIDVSTARRGTHYALVIRGDSMEPTICDGDTVIVREQPDAENGEIVVATINGDDATCKKLYKLPGGGIQLHSLNQAYDPFTFDADAVESVPVRILGKVVEMRRKF